MNYKEREVASNKYYKTIKMTFDQESIEESTAKRILALEKIKKIKEEMLNLPEAVVPIPHRGTSVIRTKINSHPYSFIISADSPGWYLIKPSGLDTAVIIRNANENEISAEKAKSPSIPLIVLWQADNSVWAASSQNIMSTKDLIPVSGNPAVYLVNTVLKPFTEIHAHFFGDKIIFGDIISTKDDDFYSRVADSSYRGLSPEQVEASRRIASEHYRMCALAIRTVFSDLGLAVYNISSGVRGAEVLVIDQHSQRLRYSIPYLPIDYKRSVSVFSYIDLYHMMILQMMQRREYNIE